MSRGGQYQKKKNWVNAVMSAGLNQKGVTRIDQKWGFRIPGTPLGDSMIGMKGQENAKTMGENFTV